MAKQKATTERFQTMLDAETVRYLEALAGKGTHGSTVPAVGRTLIMDGIRSAIEKGYIKPRE